MPTETGPLPLELLAALRELRAVFENHRLRYALIGGIAAGYRSRPRFTQDLDFLLDIPVLVLPAVLAELLQRGFTLDEAKVLREWSHDHLTVLSFRGVRIDWLKAMLPLYQHVIDRAQAENWLGGSTRIAAAEGLILTKLLAFRTQDQLDIESLLAANAEQLDLAFIRSEWLAVSTADNPAWQWFETQLRRMSQQRTSTANPQKPPDVKPEA